ncbi:vacuolar protein sorting-associated protein VPS4, putative [Perkinsus marinus ATCC 50983]|uniref:Vacuolar protein sorting-associated protein VPS4, putative n=1 Tax=Perkinsus marinus (strain ATCC 50983 / TXsc) TaxID=423536 RepID=C5K7I8_PERM5|nr:vacuolar protein sorting-associated protein VPS4, putative [Perkinsus marinus ATCC 50983]EER19523.1 vacuolar protein sorting-associated protein VPS4, putative [Perkinsus marinus ATCC 50983]|eukprot:XP_002787727.1 vacuolar protein sorting-associated protein VPS4, putative [Perkinsus marinus ATCC 50983]
MLDDTRMKRAIELAHQATALDRVGKYQEALDMYTLSLDNWMLIYKYEVNPAVKSRLSTKITEYMNRAEEIKKYLEQMQLTSTSPQPGNAGTAGMQRPLDSGDENKGPEEGGPQQGKGNPEMDKMKKALEGAIISEKPNVHWSDVSGLDQAKASLQETVILPTKFPQLFTGKRKPWKGILLYDPPGTGKSYLAKACATEAEATFFSVSSSDLVSKWMGESEKLVRSLFEMARAEKSAIIFIDEVDSLCGSRDSGENDATRRIKTEFLVQMQGVGSDSVGQVLVLGATNCPWDLDAAIRRRFERRIYIPLPDVQARIRLFELSIGDTPHELTKKDISKLAQETDGFSGADIGVLVRDALMQPIRRCSQATHFKRVTKDGKKLWTPCSPGDADSTNRQMRLMDIESSELLPPKVSRVDFQVALSNARPSVGPQDVAKQEEWTTQFGMEG